MKVEIENTISKEILIDKRIQLPIDYKHNNFDGYMKRVFDNYINLLKEYKVNDEIISVTKLHTNQLLLAINEYLIGHHNESYKLFEKTMDDLRMNNSLCIIKEPENFFYRARVNQGNIDYDNNEMFHIPMNKRGKVSSQRYSFPGLPCLYLCSSSFTCWVELDRPHFDKFQVALVKCSDKEKYKVIDLSLHPSYLYKCLTDDYSSYYIPDYLYMWPVIAACSVKVSNKDDVFKPEYIIPQFVLQYVLEKKQDVMGIKYFSIKASDLSYKQYLTDPITYVNYVFPVKSNDINEEGLSNELLNVFNIENNYSGQELTLLADTIKRTGFTWGTNSEDQRIEPSKNKVVIYNSNGFPFSYDYSIFRRIEILLKNTTNNSFEGKEE